MPRIVFVEPTGEERAVNASEGTTIMEAARSGGIPGIIGDCGGYLNCATCHGYVEQEWLAKTSPVSEAESEMLDSAFDRRENSRLLCQITISSALDGIIIRVPGRQV